MGGGEDEVGEEDVAAAFVDLEAGVSEYIAVWGWRTYQESAHGGCLLGGKEDVAAGQCYVARTGTGQSEGLRDFVANGCGVYQRLPRHRQT